MNKRVDYIEKIDKSIKNLFITAVKSYAKNPIRAAFCLKMLWWQKRAVGRRYRSSMAGIHIPPVLIFSVTNKCNMQCKGCYQQAQNRSFMEEISAEKFKSLMEETKELGISIVLLAGGEPLMRQDILDCTNIFRKLFSQFLQMVDYSMNK